MFIHIAKIVEHASNWLKAEGHAAESEIHKAAQRLVNYVGHASELEHAAEVLKKAGFTVMSPQELNPAFPEPTPNMTVQATPNTLPLSVADKLQREQDEVPPPQN